MYKIFDHGKNIEIVDNRSYIFIPKDKLKWFIADLNKILEEEI
jgi:hypothetical protein